MCVCRCRRMHATMCIWKSDDNPKYQSSSSTLFETSSVHYCVCWAGWCASLRNPGSHLPQQHRCMGITDVCCCICLYMSSGIRTQVLTAAQQVFTPWAMPFTVCRHMLVHLWQRRLSAPAPVLVLPPCHRHRHCSHHHQLQHRFPLLLSL